MMIDTSEYGQWYYLIYLLPSGAALLLLILSAMSGGGRHHPHIGTAHGHAPIGLDHGHPSAAHGTAEHHGGIGHHGAANHSGGADHHGDTAQHRGSEAGQAHASQTNGAPIVQSVLQQILTAFGMGRVPAPFIWGSLLLGWGLFGFWGTQFFESRLHAPSLFAWPALVLAIAGALGTCKGSTMAAARLMPQDETYVTDTVELCGQIGTAAFDVNDIRGRVHIYDAHGTMHDNLARTAPGRPPISRGHRVLVTDYDAANDQLIVEEIL